MEKEKLLQYLGAVRDLRAQEYVLKQTIEKLKINYSVCSNRLKFNCYRSLEQYKKTFIGYLHDNEVGIKWCSFFGISGVIISFAVPIIGVIFKIIGDSSTFISLIVWLMVLIIYSVNTVRKHYKKYKEKVEYVKRENERIKQENARDIAWDKLQLQLIPKEKDYLARKQSEVQVLLNSYLGKGILHRDYQDLVAVCSIYQYIESGRCATLGEAYNLYTDECFKKVVINKLDAILEQLSEISQTQTELYRTIQTCNSQISSLTNMMQGINSNLDRIEENTAVSAYNTELMRKNEEYRNLLYNY